MKNLKRLSSALLLVSVSAFADATDVVVNSSYLVDTKYADASSNLIILEHNREVQLAQQYSDMTRSYYAKQAAGTLTVGDTISYNSSMSALGQSVFSDIRNYQQSSQANKLIAALRSNQGFAAAEQAVKYPAMVVGGGWSIYNGASYTILKTRNLVITPGESVKSRSASLSVTSPILNASFAANAQSITTNVNRGLINHVSVNYTNTTPVQPGTATHTVSFNYGIPL